MPPLCYANGDYGEHLLEDPPTCEVKYKAIVAPKFKDCFANIKEQLTFEEDTPEAPEQTGVDVQGDDDQGVV